jgi:uncharacterized membrane protein YdjX (TVP38/TMEM64 family)
VRALLGQLVPQHDVWDIGHQKFSKMYFLNFRYFPERIEKFSTLLEDNATRLPYLLLSLRLFPMSPNWAVNMSCGVLNVPIVTFFLTVLIGLMPYNYICVTTGVILSKLTSISDVFTWTSLLQLTGVATMAVIPAFLMKGKKYI